MALGLSMPEVNLGHGVALLLEPMFAWFKSDDFAPALAGWMFLVACLFVVLFMVTEVFWRLAILSRARTGLNSVKDAEQFAVEFETLDKRLSSTPMVGRLWDEFSKTLILPDPASRLRVVQRTVSPHGYFSVEGANLRFTFYRWLPNLAVAFGLLCTFFGLVAALHYATQGIDASSGDLAKTRDALGGLLHAATFKFYTSVAGLAGSLLLSLAFRWGTKLIDGGFNSFARVLERRTVPITLKSIAYRQSLEAQEQTVQLRKFNTEIALAVGRQIEDALNKSLANHLSKAMDPVIAKLEEVTTKLSGINQDALQKMVEDFGRNIQGAAGEQIKSLGQAVTSIQESLAGMREKVAQGGNEFAESLRIATDNMGQTIAALRGALEDVAHRIELIAQNAETAGSTMAEAANSIRDASAPLAVVGENIAAAARNIDSSVAGISAAMEALSQQTRSTEELLAGTLSTLRQAWVDHENSVQRCR